MPESKEENVVQLAIDLDKTANVKLDWVDIDPEPRPTPQATTQHLLARWW